jgi:cytochrome c1
MFQKSYITDQEFKAIWAYLRYMQNHKKKPADLD